MKHINTLLLLTTINIFSWEQLNFKPKYSLCVVKELTEAQRIAAKNKQIIDIKSNRQDINHANSSIQLEHNSEKSEKTQQELITQLDRIGDKLDNITTDANNIVKSLDKLNEIIKKRTEDN